MILEKQLTGHRVDRSICNWFWDQPHSFKQQPVIASPTHYLFQVFRDGITFLACTQLEMPPLMAIEVIVIMRLFAIHRNNQCYVFLLTIHSFLVPL